MKEISNYHCGAGMCEKCKNCGIGPISITSIEDRDLCDGCYYKTIKKTDEFNQMLSRIKNEN